MRIPELSPEERAARAHIRPLVLRDSRYYSLPDHDIEDVSFSWLDPTLFEGKLRELAKIRTLHAYGYYGLFKPSVYEVHAQIPKHLVKETRFFVCKGPSDFSDFSREQEAFDAGFHVAETTLYALE